MKRIGYIVSAVSIAFVLTASYGEKTIFAGSSCCGDKEAAAAENKCIVCGKAVEKGKGVQVACEGKTLTVCCKKCEDALKKGCEDEKGSDKHEGHQH